VARDFYADGFEIAERLREEHLNAWADRVERSIDQGFTATEILMALRADISALLAADISIEPSTRLLAEDLRSAISAALEV
jgi:hypothetical protein